MTLARLADVRMSDLPSIGTAALPANYQAATEALAQCNNIDECKDWADKMAALASYAKQADDRTLHQLAVRISARAIRRCGELLQTFQSPGGRPSKTSGGAPTGFSQRQAAAEAGLSKDQEVTAVRVANVPAEDFEAAVERDDPATVTQLAEMGKSSKPAPPGFVQATNALGTIKQFAIFCAEHPAPFIAGAIYPYETAAVRANVAVITEWLVVLVSRLQEAE